MKQEHFKFSVSTQGRGIYCVSREVCSWVRRQDIQSGLLTLFIPHTSASLLIQENADPDVLEDLNQFFNRLVPDGDSLFQHQAEGPDDMPAHVRSALTQTQLSIPVQENKPDLGIWQGIYLFEHRTHPHKREILLHLIGE
ncbi:MAG: secondary thiamine-phosphate synthase enzyme YjbQ [Nitrospinaceae bacterium]|jgi:secondary thiamine-phosphate synthase enzyme|nr:secondary thiamine-phosphate synthase enzyme YjbQ [Nitrospinaceae bacterium]MEE3346901.1 secondary thiamine-phosphate synthase enzyme YjbQ [Nitrospinota bacterium]